MLVAVSTSPVRSGQAAGRHRPARGVGRVLGQLDNYPVAIADQREVVLDVGIGAEPGRGLAPRRQHAPAKLLGGERVGNHPTRVAHNPAIPLPRGHCRSGGSSGMAERLGGLHVAHRARLVTERATDHVVAGALLGQRGRGLWRGRRDDDGLRVRPAAVVDGDDAAVIRCVLVGTRAERLPEPTGERDEEATAGARSRRGARDGGFRARLAGVPTLDGLHPALVGQHALATEAELVLDFALLVVIGREEGRRQPWVVGRRRAAGRRRRGHRAAVARSMAPTRAPAGRRRPGAGRRRRW